MRIVLLITATTISSVLLSCHRNSDSPDAPGTRLKEVITNQAIRDSNVFTFFHYNDQGLLTQVVDSFHVLTNNFHYLDTAVSYPFQYNAQGNLEKLDYRQGSVYAALYDLRVYNSKNLLVQNTHVNQYDQDTAITVYMYDNNDRLIADSTYRDNIPGKIDFTTYTYDGNDNISTWKRFTDSLGTITVLDSSEISYDNNRNPYHTLGINLYSLRNKEQVLSKNNIAQQKFSDGSIYSYQYVYFGNGLPKDVMVTVTSPASIPNREFHFSYE